MFVTWVGLRLQQQSLFACTRRADRGWALAMPTACPLDVPFLLPGDHRRARRVGSAQPASSVRPCLPGRLPGRLFSPGGSWSAGLAVSPAPAQVGHGQLPGLMTCSLAQPRQHPYWGGWVRISKAGTHTGATASLILWFLCRGWQSRLETQKLRSFIAASFVSLHCWRNMFVVRVVGLCPLLLHCPHAPSLARTCSLERPGTYFSLWTHSAGQ